MSKRDLLDKKILKILTEKIKDMKPHSIRDAISKIRTENLGLTINAAAYEFARRRKIKISRYLKDEDRKSISSANVISTVNTTSSRLSRKVKNKQIKTSYGQEFINGANNNAEAYQYVYILENSLRKIIKIRFKDDQNWWETKVGGDVKEYATKIKEAEKKHDWLPKRGDHPIFYIGLNELFKIINKNYSTHFRNIFTDAGNLRTWINECVPIRNLIAHNIPLKNEEKQNLILRTKYICTLIENYTKTIS